MERIKFECVGTVFQKKAPNGMLMTGIIVDDPDQFKLYKLLELDVFDNSSLINKSANVTEVTPLTEEKVVEVLTEMINAKPKTKGKKNKPPVKNYIKVVKHNYFKILFLRLYHS